MSLKKCDQEPEPGDLIEIFRDGHQRWAIYAGEGCVIHLPPPCEQAGAGAAVKIKSVLGYKSTVKKEELDKVVGNDDYRINNILDDKYKPWPIQSIMREAHSLVGRELSYSLLGANSEHFVTKLRYGKPQSRQVQDAVVNVAGTVVELVAGAVAMATSPPETTFVRDVAVAVAGATNKIFTEAAATAAKAVDTGATVYYDKKPEPGDLIEIFRDGYQHWVIYVGEGYVVHLPPPCEHAGAGAAVKILSVLCYKSKVNKEELDKVVGNDKYRINNILDDKYEPQDIEHIMREAHSLLGQERPYSVLGANSEHFVTELRYGERHSRQVQDAVVNAAGTAAEIFAKVAAKELQLLQSNRD